MYLSTSSSRVGCFARAISFAGALTAINTITSNINILSENGEASDELIEREYSSHSGLSRGAVRYANRVGRLVFYAEGSINAAASDLRRAEMTAPHQQRRSRGGDAVLLHGSSGLADRDLKVCTALTDYQARERQLAIQKKKGTLVDRVRAAAQVFHLARQKRDVWVTWPVRGGAARFRSAC